MAHRQSVTGGYKQETMYKADPGAAIVSDHHQAPHMPHQRQQHHQQATPQHTTAYQPAHLPQYGQNGASQGGQHAENPYYTHTSPYTAPSATGPYTSAASEAPDILAASGMTRAAYPSIYHTPQSNSPASIASPSGHDQHGRQIYTQTPYHLQQQQAMNYPPPPSNYPQIPQGNPSPYGQQQQPQHHQGMGQQSNLLMSHQQAQHQMQHPSQLSQQMPSPRGAKPDLPPNGLQRSAPVQQGQTPQQHHQQILNAPPNGTQNNIPGAGVNPTTNPGPIPATTPLIVRQDQNGVQWIAFEYSRDRVKMEYTIRCDVEAVNVDNLSADFKSENCVYPRACCSKDQYRGNRFGYETDCNTVGWGLAELNPCLRGKRGLIQRAVDSWRNSNQDPKYRSRRVRRMAKLTNRKNNGMAQMAAQMQMPGQGMALPDMTARAPPPAHRPGATMAQQQPLPQHHQQHAHPDHTAVAGPDDVTANTTDPALQALSPQQTQQQPPRQPYNPTQASNAQQNQQATAYNAYPAYPHPSNTSRNYTSAYPQPPSPVQQHQSRAPLVPLTNEGHSTNASAGPPLDPALFPPGVKMPSYLHVPERAGESSPRKKVPVDIRKAAEGEIPDSVRLKSAAFARSWTGVINGLSRSDAEFDDLDAPDHNSNDAQEVEGRYQRRNGKGKMRSQTIMANLATNSNDIDELAVPRLTTSARARERGVNMISERIAWVGQKVLADRPGTLRRTVDMYRDKVAHSIREAGLDIDDYPLYERRRIRRLFLEKWNGNEDAETDAGPVPRLFRSQAYVGHLVAAGVSGPAVGMHAMPQQRRMIRA